MNRRRLPSVLTVKTACQSSLTATFTVKFLRMCMGKKTAALWVCPFAPHLMKKPLAVSLCAQQKDLFCCAQWQWQANVSIDEPHGQTFTDWGPDQRAVWVNCNCSGQPSAPRTPSRGAEPDGGTSDWVAVNSATRGRRLSLDSVGSLSWPDFSCHESA